MGCFVQAAYGCVCDTPSECQGYSLANKVFVGKLLEKVALDVNGREVIEAKFESSETLKGSAENGIRIVRFNDGGCAPTLSTGEEYLVFDLSEVANSVLYCNPTRLLRDANSYLEYARFVSQYPSTFSVSGRLTRLGEDELTRVKVIVSYQESEISVAVGRDGKYSGTIPADVDYKVKIDFGSKVSGLIKDGASSRQIDGRWIEYSGHSVSGGCDDRELDVALQVRGH